MIHSDHIYTTIHTSSNKVLVSRNSLQQLLSKIKDKNLVQCHRSYIVNCNFITSFTNDSIVLNDSITIPVSRSKRDEILSRIAY